jgi:fructokinase
MRIGIDLGGTKIEAAALGDDGVLRGRRRVATPRSYGELVRALGELVDGLERAHGRARGVGVAAPGSLAPARPGVAGPRRWHNAQNTPLDGHAFVDDLAAALPGRAVAAANDAHCFALSEARDGGGAGAAVVFGVILGTGVGGGLVVDGRLVAGAGGIAGEWGHNPLPWPRADESPGPSCTCGRRGCIEAWLAGPGLARDHVVVTGAPLPGDVISARAAAGDAACRATVGRWAERLARALATIVHVVDPDVIVVGGGLSQVDALYELCPPLLGEHTLSPPATRMVRHVHGDASGLRGAAWLVG